MKSLSRILTICLCAAPVIHSAWGVVATTSGSNLTSFNPSNAYNNQWATLSNGRGDMATPTAKVDFGNCNALILRCAQPKCANGGCTDMNVAGAIVAGCVQSNKSCEKYGDDLVSYMSAQLVANSNAKINAQNAAAAQAAAAAQQEQITAMQAQMQQQMAQMQQQMAQQSAQMQQQNEQTQQQIQAALDAQAQQNQAALNNMASAATVSVAQPTDSGITSYQQEAVDRGISTDILERQTITGQIMTEIEDAENSLKEVRTAMVDAFEYAGCDARGNNCTGPKRIKKFRERALNFIDPYDNVIDKIDDALSDAQVVGVDLSEIYLLLNNSCNRWGKYLCPQGTVVYDTGDKGQRTSPKVCDASSPTSGYKICVDSCVNVSASQGLLRHFQSLGVSGEYSIIASEMSTCLSNCAKNFCQPCTPIQALTNNDEVYIGWVNAETTSDENQTVVACMSSALDDSYIGRRSKRKRGVGIVDIDLLETWLSQTEPSIKTKTKGPDKFIDYCFPTGGDIDTVETTLSKASLSKTIVKDYPLCVEDLGKVKGVNKLNDDEGCSYISPIYAFCDTHMYNVGETEPSKLKDVNLKGTIKEIVALKSTVVAQQMYKQYEFLAATLRRLKIHLEKSVLSANLQAAGGFSGGGSSSGGGSYVDDDDKSVVLKGATNCSAIMDFDQFVTCLQSNVSLITTHANSDTTNACKQLQYTLEQANTRFSVEGYPDGTTTTNGNGSGSWKYCKEKKYLNQAGEKNCKGSKKKQDIINCANEILTHAAAIKSDKNRYNHGGFYIPGLTGK